MPIILESQILETQRKIFYILNFFVYGRQHLGRNGHMQIVFSFEMIRKKKHETCTNFTQRKFFSLFLVIFDI